MKTSDTKLKTVNTTTTSVEVSHEELANAIRVLTMDAVQSAKSGHPGLPMGMADVATVLFSQFLKFDPDAPHWPDRDRLVLSAGHGSMLLYALLYLTGYAGMDIGQLSTFRQLKSSAAGHPEYGSVGGIETTTGPLGQGIANAVGMTLAERMMAARYGVDLVDHRTYVIAGDGCLMEGISHETASLAGHLKLSRLTLLFDDNGITIDGPTSLAVSDDQGARFAALGWHVQRIDGHDPEAVANAIREANGDPRPSMIACQTTIGYGAPTKQGTSAAHGAPLGEEEIAAARLVLNWHHPPFQIPKRVLDRWRQVGKRGDATQQAWEARLGASDQRANFENAIAGLLPTDWSDALDSFKDTQIASGKAVATRKASELVLEIINQEIPNMIGGSADLTGSNNTKVKNMVPVKAGDFRGNYIYYGVREHAMAAAMNGISLHGGLIPYGGTFLVFSDYARPAMRLSALMGLRVIYVMTHDSIGLGEDGPTHQPVEHLAALRAIPNLAVFRPADSIETAECWALALSRESGPSVLALTRQNLPIVRYNTERTNPCAGGAYELLSADGVAVVTLLASGSEIAIAVEARDRLQDANIPTRVVSMPCWELIENLEITMRATLLGRGTLRVGIEAAVRSGWDRWIGEDGMFFGMTGFGASAPYKDLYDHFGLTAEKIATRVHHHLDTTAPRQKG